MILGQGVEAFWLDMNEPAKYHTDWLFWNEAGKPYGNFGEVNNALALMHNKSMFDKLSAGGTGKRSFMLTRSGYLGTQRYASPWTGDIQGSWTSMHEQIGLGTSLSLTGYNYWGFDIGGFFSSVSPDMYMRWVELACFTPVHRFHYLNQGSKEPPRRSVAEQDVAREYIGLRYRLKPYMYSLTADNIIGIGIEKGYGPGGTGIPYVRPMVMEYPEDKRTWQMDTQFMAGPSFLVAPVVTASETKQVYLPPGTWYDYFNNPLLIEGGQTISYAAPQEVLPVFVKEGAIIPMQPDMQYMREKLVDVVTLDIYPLLNDGTFNFTLYEDDNTTNNYKNGEYAVTPYECEVEISGDTTDYTFKIGARTGAFTPVDDQIGQGYRVLANRSYLLMFHTDAIADLKVELDGSALTRMSSYALLEAASAGYYVDTIKRVCYVKFPDNGAAKVLTLSGDDMPRDALESEYGLLAGGAVIGDTKPGFSGKGYVTDLQASGDSVTQSVLVDTEGLYQIYIRVFSDAETALAVGTGGRSLTVPVPGSGIWEETMALLRLERGNNEITISGTGTSGHVLVDCLRMPSGVYTPPPFSGNIIEAEASVLSGNVRAASGRTGFSGTGYVERFDAAGDSVTFQDINVLKSGNYALRLRYRTDLDGTAGNALNARSLSVYSNGNPAGAVSVDLPRCWLDNSTVVWETAIVTVPLNAGDNSVTVERMAANNGSDVSIDYLYYPLEQIDLQNTDAIVNGGFDTGNTSGWTVSPNNSFGGVDAGDRYMGSNKLYFWVGSGSINHYLSQTVTGLENGEYILDFCFKTYNTRFNAAQIQLNGGAGFVNHDIPYTGSWSRMDVPATVTNGQLVVRFYYNSGSGSSMQLDGVTLWRVVSKDAYLRASLAEAIAEARAIKGTAYTDRSYTRLLTALFMAEAWYGDLSASPDQLMNGVMILDAARARLMLKSSTLEAEDARRFGDIQEDDSVAGYSGSGYVSGLTTSADRIEIEYDHEGIAGLYEVYLRYSSDYGTSVTMSTGGAETTVPVKLTGRQQGAWEEAVALLELKADVNTIVIAGEGSPHSEGALIDCIRVAETPFTPPAPVLPPPPDYNNITWTRLEAEGAVRTTGVTAGTSTSASGGASNNYVTSFTAAGRSVTFTLNVPAAGDYTMKLGYVSTSSTRYLSAYANSDPPRRMTFEYAGHTGSGMGSGSRDWFEHHVTLKLNAGVNTVTIGYLSGDDGANVWLDYLEYPSSPVVLTQIPIPNGGFDRTFTTDPLAADNWLITFVNPASGGSQGVDGASRLQGDGKLYLNKDSNQFGMRVTRYISQSLRLQDGAYLVEFWSRFSENTVNDWEETLLDMTNATGHGMGVVNIDAPYSGWKRYSSDLIDFFGDRLNLVFKTTTAANVWQALSLDAVRMWRVDSGEADVNALREVLRAAVAAGKLVDGLAYAYQSFNEFQAALQYGQLVCDDMSAGYGTINAAIILIEDARAALKLRATSAAFVEDPQGVLSAVFSFDNTATAKTEVLGIVAIYDENGRLHKVSVNPFTANAGEFVTKQIKVDIPPGYSAKAFLWDAVTYAPLCEAAAASGAII